MPSKLIGIKSLSKQTKITVANISDGVAKRDDLSILPTKELVDGIMTWTERQGDGWIPQSRRTQARLSADATWHLRRMSGLQES